jgi:hypothetical protein
LMANVLNCFLNRLPHESQRRHAFL